MKDRKLATRYARALLSTLPDAGSQDRADTFLAALASSIADNRALREFLLDPAATHAAKARALRAIADGQGGGKGMGNFLETIVVHGRLPILDAIAEVFHDERERAQGIVTATLSTAAPIPDDLRARATQALERLSGRKVNLKVEVDPTLLGGARAQVGSMVYDGSIRTQLDRLRARLAEE
ncbi:MAG TPA: ATP synthase F1 subunit delta [Candidatus Sulfotelmatobacter sp.]|jgi:F-type H+-transporting ATPase subunit delta|nr:ATP synthase F1 subunit delta [Candidatus Sulfotelmatobacter sp.]